MGEDLSRFMNLSFEEFKARLKEHFRTGYVLADETELSDLDTADRLLSDL